MMAEKRFCPIRFARITIPTTNPNIVAETVRCQQDMCRWWVGYKKAENEEEDFDCLFSAWFSKKLDS